MVLFSAALKIASILILYFSHSFVVPRKDVKPLAHQLLKDRTSVIAFRGGALDGKENSESAIRQAIALGADVIHFDVSVTADGQLAVIHNTGPQRVYGRKETTDQLSLEELGPYEDLTIGMYGDPVHIENVENEGTRELSQLLPLFNEKGNDRVGIIVSTEIRDVKLLVIMINEFEEADLIDRVAFDILVPKQDVLDHIEYPVTFTNSSQDAENLVRIYESFFNGTGVEAFRNRDFDIFQTSYNFNQPDELIRIKSLSGDPIRDELFAFLQTREKSVGLMSEVANRDALPVVYGVANQDRDFAKAIWLGANAIMTESPASLIALLELHKKRKDRDSREDEEFPRGPGGPRESIEDDMP